MTKQKMYFYYYLERQIAYHKKMKGASSNEYYSNIIIKLESLILFVVLQNSDSRQNLQRNNIKNEHLQLISLKANLCTILNCFIETWHNIQPLELETNGGAILRQESASNVWSMLKLWDKLKWKEITHVSNTYHKKTKLASCFEILGMALYRQIGPNMEWFPFC